MDKVQQIVAEIARLDVENTRKGIYKEISRDCECGFANALTLLRNFIHSLPEESVSDDLEEEIQRHLKDCLDVKFPTTDIESIKKDVEFTARYFAKWQKEQFEKNRLAACDAQTPEEAEREMNFVEHIIKEEHRQPTFSDAIEYGMMLQRQEDNQDDSDMAVIAHLDSVESGKAIMKEQMMKEAVEGIIIISHGEKVVLHPSRHGKAEMSLPDEIIDKYGIDDKVKIIFIKEE